MWGALPLRSPDRNVWKSQKIYFISPAQILLWWAKGGELLMARAKKSVKKVAKRSSSPASRSRSYTVHPKLEKPVHNLLSYTVLFLLALVVLFLVLKLMGTGSM